MMHRLSRNTVSLAVAALLAAACDGGGSSDAMVTLPDGGWVDAPTGTDGGDGGATDAGSGRMCTAGGSCDVIAQNCPMATEGCYYAASMPGGPASTMCMAAGTRGDGAPCAFVNDCLPGFSCSEGACRRYCCMGATGDCPPGQICISIAGSDIGQCTPDAMCTLVPNEGCGGGQGCYIAAGDGTLSCFSAGAGDEGMACEALNACRPGMGCLGSSGGSFRCTRFCRLSRGEADCGGGGRTCMPVRGLALPEDVGICPLPG